MKKNTLSQVVLSLILCMMFVLGSVFMLMYGARAYAKGTASMAERENEQIPLAYLSTKIYQAENLDSVEVKDGVITIHSQGYSTSIYYEEHALYELVYKGDKKTLEGGTKICDILSYSVSQQKDVFYITVNGTTMKVRKVS